MLLGPVRSFSRSRLLISSILDPFRFNFDLLDPPPYCVFLQDRDSVLLEDRDSVCLEDRDCCSSQQEEFVCLQETDCCSSATGKSSPNPSYLRSGELVLPWDTKNRSSHTQIVHIDILRAQMYLKSDETEGTRPSEHMDIFAKNKLVVPRGVERCLGGTMCQNHRVFSVKVA